jgi:uncharacterized repeat protein (TIGR03806 family)
MPLPRLSCLLLLLALTACGGGGGSGDGGGGDSQGFGLAARASPSSVTIPTGAGGGTAATSLRAVNAFPNVSVPGPTFLTHAGDGTNRLFVSDRGGLIAVFANNPNATQTAFLDIRSRVDSTTGEGGLIGLAFDPAYRTNGYFYVNYVNVNASGQRKVRISRFRDTSRGANTAAASSEKVVLEIDHANGYHFGGWLGFGPDGMLYISHGDGGNQNSTGDSASLFGKVLRIRVDANSGTYTIPSDNPFGNAVWAMGFRNPWRCSFDRGGNRDLYCGDVGEGSREEINRVKKGLHYGWPFFEGSQPFAPSARPYSAFEPPLVEYPHSVGVAVVGGYVYRGAALPSQLGRYFYSDAGGSGNVWQITLDGSGNAAGNAVAASGVNSVFSMGEDEAGEIYAASQPGIIYRFEAGNSANAGAAMPATLSATGLFSNLAKLTPSPGVIDYEVNSPFWSDGARKQRWLVVPDGAVIGFAADGAWSFPLGTITVKHFELPRAGGGATRVETRVMVNRSDGWTGYTYRWRADQSDADLLTAGATAAYDGINPATGAATRINWTFPSQAQCLNCHTQAAGRVLGINTLQWNRDHIYQSSGNADNQLRALNHIGLFGQDIGAAAQYGAMPDPSSAQAPLESRAKAYLESNCANCHQPGGPTSVNMDLRYGTAVPAMNIVGVAAGIPTVSGALRIAPGSHATSDLWRRATSTTTTRMPPLGVTLVDEQGLQSLSAWIDSLR